jgi:DNA mismatch repair protein MutS2
MGFRGTVVALEGDQAVVQGAGARVRIPLARLVVRRGAAREPEPRVVEARPELVAVPAEIDVRGERAERARAIVRDAVDAAAPVGRPTLRVIHGKGTGALRAAVREELDRHPLVVRHETAGPREGGDGATVVVLSERSGPDGPEAAG